MDLGEFEDCCGRKNYAEGFDNCVVLVAVSEERSD